MRQNRHSLLAFPKLNKEVSIASEGKALLEAFCHYENPIPSTGQVTRTINLD